MRTSAQQFTGLAVLTLFSVLASTVSASVLLSDNFNYPNGPLAGSGAWARGANSPASDNPSDHIVVSNGAVRFDWTTSTPINNVVRTLWEGREGVSSGMVYVIFEFKMIEAPKAESDVRPGFFSLGNFDGSQQRGYVGVQRGSRGNSFRLGVSPLSQLGPAFTYLNKDLSLNTAYTVMLGFDAETQETSLWIGTTNPSNTADVRVPGSGTSSGIRRANFRIYNSDGGSGTTNLGVFEVDNLIVTTSPES